MEREHVKRRLAKSVKWLQALKMGFNSEQRQQLFSSSPHNDSGTHTFSFQIGKIGEAKN
jgi:hypothetical protein